MSEPGTFISGASYIHYDPERVDYTISESELQSLKDCYANLWKDFCLAGCGIGVPCVINAISIYKRVTPFAPSIDFVLNTIVGLVCVILGLCFGIAWYRTSTSASDIIDAIKKKPKFIINQES
jgi:hypothetical protein